MTNFDAIGIEHTLARFFGKTIGDRTQFYDADVFRGGKPKRLAKIIDRVAKRLEQRFAKIKTPVSARVDGDPLAQIEGCIRRLSSLAEKMEHLKAEEPEDYHWEVFGTLMMAIVGLLELLEKLA
jgi:hypothetical protein